MFGGEARKNIKPMVDAPHNDEVAELVQAPVCKTGYMGSNPILVSSFIVINCL